MIRSLWVPWGLLLLSQVYRNGSIALKLTMWRGDFVTVFWNSYLFTIAVRLHIPAIYVVGWVMLRVFPGHLIQKEIFENHPYNSFPFPSQFFMASFWGNHNSHHINPKPCYSHCVEIGGLTCSPEVREKRHVWSSIYPKAALQCMPPLVQTASTSKRSPADLRGSWV